MELKVNGVLVPVGTGIVVVLDVDPAGETIPDGVDIHVRGGPLTVMQGDHSLAAFHVNADSQVALLGRDPSGAVDIRSSP